MNYINIACVVTITHKLPVIGYHMYKWYVILGVVTRVNLWHIYLAQAGKENVEGRYTDTRLIMAFKCLS